MVKGPQSGRFTVLDGSARSFTAGAMTLFQGIDALAPIASAESTPS
jgi:hypothetical protein